MSFVLLGGSVFLLAYAAAIVLGTALTLPLLPGAARLRDPAARARRLAGLRVFPTAFALLVLGGLVVPAFLQLEPRNTSERVSGAIAFFAVLGLLMLVTGPARGLLSILSTRRLLSRWARDSRPIDLPGISLPGLLVNETFPLVSVVGWFHPRVVVARMVLESCDPDELAAVLAHEAGHNDRRDPWVQLLLRACPDLLSMTPLALRVERAWSEAAEQDADERAARTGRTRAMDLASALVKIARLARTVQPPAIPASSLYRGQGVAGRIARLLERCPTDGGERSTPTRLLLSAGLVLSLALVPTAAAFGLDQGVHEVLEAVVTFFQ